MFARQWQHVFCVEPFPLSGLSSDTGCCKQLNWPSGMKIYLRVILCVLTQSTLLIGTTYSTAALSLSASHTGEYFQWNWCGSQLSLRLNYSAKHCQTCHYSFIFPLLYLSFPHTCLSVSHSLSLPPCSFWRATVILQTRIFLSPQVWGLCLALASLSCCIGLLYSITSFWLLVSSFYLWLSFFHGLISAS